jgi:hypothetical protein
MTEYTSKRIIDGKVRIVIVDENDNISNRKPSKEELKCLEEAPYKRHNKVKTCCNCESHDTYQEHWYKHKCQKMICTRYLCRNCWQKYDPNGYNNMRRLLTDRRTDNLKDLKHMFGDNCTELACILYGWENLNDKYDNYRTPIDCYDQKTGMYHQVQGRHYNSRSNQWPFNGFKDEWRKVYETMVGFCISEEGSTVERIYKFCKKEIDRITGISIYKNPTDSHENLIISRFEKYRETNEDELKRANKNWTQILEEENKSKLKRKVANNRQS